MERLVYTASELGAFERLMRAQTEWRETAPAYAIGLASHTMEQPDEIDPSAFTIVPLP